MIFLPIALFLKVFDLVTLDRFLKEHKEIAVPPFIHNVFLGLLYLISFFIIVKLYIPNIKLTGIKDKISPCPGSKGEVTHLI